jgi:hypothetical protein
MANHMTRLECTVWVARKRNDSCATTIDSGLSSLTIIELVTLGQGMI